MRPALAGVVELLRSGRVGEDFWDWREGQDFCFGRRGADAAAFTAEADAAELAEGGESEQVGGAAVRCDPCIGGSRTKTPMV